MLARSLIAGFVVIASCALEAVAQERWPRVVDPATYDSPSGEFHLDVDPSSISGAGGARYRMSRRGTLAWEGEKPFTLSDAQVTREGVVVGYSYSEGVEVAEDSDVHLVILNPDGSVRLDERIPRHYANVPDGPPEPYVLGAQVDLDGDRVIFRPGSGWIDGVWRVYELSSGRFRSLVKRPPARSPADREPVRHSRVLPTPPPPTEQVRPWLMRNLGTIQLGPSRPGSSAPTSPRRDSASDGVLGNAGDWVLDSADNIYVVDVKTAVVRVFNRLGARLRIIPIARRGVVLFDPALSVAGDGTVLVRPDFFPPNRRFLRLAPEGKPPLARQVSANSILPNLATGGSWGVSPIEVTQFRSDFTPAKRVLRRLDGRWLYPMVHAAAGMDGSLAVASIEAPGAREWELNVLSAQGIGQKSARMPRDADGSTFAYDGRRLVYWQGGAIRIRDLSDGSVLDFLPDDLRPFSILPMKIAGAGRELWVLDPMRWLVRRFEMP